MGRVNRVQAGLRFLAELLAEAFGSHLQSGLDRGGDGLDRACLVLVLGIQNPALALRNRLVPELGPRQLVAPVAEGALGELHDVALVNQSHRLVAVLDGITNAAPHQLLGSSNRHGLDAHAGIEPYLLVRFVFAQQLIDKLDQSFRLRGAFTPFDSSVYVFGVLTKDDDIHVLRMPHWRGESLDVLHRPPAGIEIQQLPQRHIEAADAAAHRRGERSLDGNPKIPDRLERFFGQPLTGPAEGLLAGEDFVPDDPPFAGEGAFHRRVKHSLGGLPDIPSGAVAFDIRNNGVVRHHKLAISKGDSSAFLRHGDSVVGLLHEQAFSSDLLKFSNLTDC